MHFIQMGSDTHPTILLIHGLSATAESCYGEVGRLITAATCRSACREIYAYHIPESLNRIDYAVEFWRGSNEYYPKKSAELLRAYLSDMTERVFPNMGHCQFLHEQPNSYAELVDAFMRE